MDKISKYTKFFDLLIVSDQENDEMINAIASDYFRSSRSMSINNEINTTLTCHLLLIVGSGKNILDKKSHQFFSTIHRMDTLILLRDEITTSVYKEALNLRAVHVGGIIRNEHEFSQMLLPVLPGIIKRHNETHISQYYKQIMENSAHMHWIHRNGKSVFVNDALKRFFGFNGVAEFDLLNASKVLTHSADSTWITLKNIQAEESSFYVTVEQLSAHETLVSLVKGDHDKSKGEKQFLNRISFIEVLKDSFVIHQNENEAIPIVIVLIENSDKIIDEFGENTYNDIGVQLYRLMQKEFNTTHLIAQWYKNVFVLLDTHLSVESLRDNLERLHANVIDHASVDGAVPMMASFILDLSGIELNKAINLIDHIHERQLIASDLSHMICHEISFNDGTSDVKAQAIHYLEKMFYAKSDVRLLNFYKGIRISTPGKIIKLSDGIVFIGIEKIQGYAMQLEGSVVLQGTNIPFDISAEIKLVDIGKKVALLHNFEPLNVSANNRQHIRIQSDHRMHVTMHAHRQMSSGTIADISIASIALKMNSSKGIPEKGTDVSLQFNLPLKRMNDEPFPMVVKGKIGFISEMEEFTKVVVLLELEEPYESYLIEYIYNRQQNLVNEIKSIVSKL